MSAVNASLPQPPQESFPEARPAEPSMEDILASIRRIIADDQSRNSAAMATFRRAPVAPTIDQPPAARQPTAEAVVPQSDPVAPAPAAAQAASLVTAGRAEPIAVPVEPVATAAPAPHVTPPATIADEHPPEFVDQIASAAVASILRPRFNTAPPAEGFAVAAPPAAPVEPKAAQGEALVVHAPPQDETLPDETPHPETGEVHDDGVWLADYQDGEALVSAEAETTIESSFQALATSVFLQNTDRVEQMMREMLRPLLKTWLDDNLPTIVERLVRIEIERVARGGRANS